MEIVFNCFVSEDCDWFVFTGLKILMSSLDFKALPGMASESPHIFALKVKEIPLYYEQLSKQLWREH